MSSLRRPSSQGSDDTRKMGSPSMGAEAKRSVDFAMDFFKSNDPAETKLLDILEENTTSMASSRPKPPRGHRRRASKLQHMAKQMSSRRFIQRQESSDELDPDMSNNNNSGSSDTRQPKSDSNLYRSLSNNSEAANGGTSPGRTPQLRARGRAHSYANGTDESYRGSSARKRASLPSRDLQAPTSIFLSDLSEKLNDSKSAFDLDPTPEEEMSPRKSPKGRHRRLRTTTDALYDPHAPHLATLFQIDSNNSFDGLPSMRDLQPTERPGLSGTYSDLSDDDAGSRDRDLEGGANDTSPLLRRPRQPQRLSPAKRAYDKLLACFRLIGPRDIWNGIIYFLMYRVLMLVVPMLSVSALLFFGFKNPNFHFLPSDATMSWWLIFAARLVLTFSLAEASQYALEIITTRTSIIVKVAGPFAALVAMQSLGWPFIMASWGFWTIVLMHGSYPFVKNWIWFLHISMFSREHNPDGGVLEGDAYARFLLGMVFVGVATAAKRMVVALYLSRRMLQYYRQQLRELLADMKLVMEVAELAAQTETKEFEELIAEEMSLQNSLRSGEASQQRRNSVAGDVAMTTLKATASKVKSEKLPNFPTPMRSSDVLMRASGSDDEDDDFDDDLALSDNNVDDASAEGNIYPNTPASGRSAMSKRSYAQSSVSGSEAFSFSKGPVQWNELKRQVDPQRSTVQHRASSPVEMRAMGEDIQQPYRSKPSQRGVGKLISQLQAWEEPETKSKRMLPSLYDVLQFRKALETLENAFPFSNDFGLARTRKECIRSAVRVYRRLLRFTPGESVLNFEVIGALAYDDDDDLDEKRAQSLLKVFHPDKDDLISQLSFVESCDNVYKHLRFLRASILNSSKIDSVLEDVFDVVFNGVLAILVMTILGLNPWPLLVSFSTLMVSFAFSFGPSCAKYIEGTLMIAVRRPYDIGDRITIISGESLTQPESGETWLVEDISLSTTTLRYAATNEVSTVNNAAISNSRIVNGARSPLAIVTITINFDISATQEKIDMFRIRVENFLFDRPEIWQGLVHFRNDDVDHNMNCARYLLRVQHKKSWQDMPPVMVDRGELQRYADKVALDLEIVWRYQHRIRLVEMPAIVQAQLTENDDSDVQSKEEPFMKFIKAETGY